MGTISCNKFSVKLNLSINAASKFAFMQYYTHQQSDISHFEFKLAYYGKF